MAICHGGMGITQRAVSHGVPVVVVPFGRDQLEVGRRVEHAGVGVMVSHKKLTPARLAASVRQARELRPAALRLADELADADGDRAAAGVVEELLSGWSRSTGRGAANTY
ncbi:MAG: glycosyltransferase [Acidimicrobiia bacterium]